MQELITKIISAHSTSWTYNGSHSPEHGAVDPTLGFDGIISAHIDSRAGFDKGCDLLVR
jgi:hypothetical protein